MNDGELESCIARTAEGNADALHCLYGELGDAVYALARAVTHDQLVAQDVLQDVFIKVYAAAGCYLPHGKPRAWVMRIARNEAISALRKRKRELPTDLQAMEVPQRESEFTTPEHVDMDRALKRLAPLEREIVLLSVLGGLTNREVAKLLGIPSGSVSWRYRAAIGKLRESLSGVEW
jgi:RNA polymerase sigma-70 factor (ECF subfamily)